MASEYQWRAPVTFYADHYAAFGEWPDTKEHGDALLDGCRGLLADNERLRAESVTERRFTDDYIKLLHKAEAKIKAALALHKPGIWTGTIKCCVACSVKRTGPTLWPCPTVKALRGGDDAE